jgi:hypothetical protein
VASLGIVTAADDSQPSFALDIEPARIRAIRQHISALDADATRADPTPDSSLSAADPAYSDYGVRVAADSSEGRTAPSDHVADYDSAAVGDVPRTSEATS